MRADGYAFTWEPDRLTPHGYLAGTDRERGEAFNAAVTAARHILCVRGGYGCLRLLDRIDYEAARRRPALLTGFSDITALQWALYHRAGWRSISGPVVVEWAEIDLSMKAAFRAWVTGGVPALLSRLKPLQTGTCTGTLLGGNLASIVRLVGSEYMPDLEGAVLFVEDVNEPLYRVDALFAQLGHAGLLTRLGGLILGHFTEKSGALDVTPVVSHYAAQYGWPVATGLDYGHTVPREVLPIGVTATLVVTEHEASLQIHDAVVRGKFNDNTGVDRRTGP